MSTTVVNPQEESQKSKAMQRGLGGFPHERLHQEVKSQKLSDLHHQQCCGTDISKKERAIVLNVKSYS